MYTLEPYKSPSTRHTCPSCGAKRQFARYINTETNEYLAEHVGRCNREQNCSYHYTPKQYFHDHPEFNTIKKDSFKLPQSNPTRLQVPSPYKYKIPFSFSSGEGARRADEVEKGFRDEVSSQNYKPPSLIPDSILQSSLSNYKHNHFITFLKSIFDPTTVTHLISTYFIGTSKNWPGSTVFWQIDCHGNIRDGKIMLYDPASGHRVKQPYNHITWAHSALKLKDYSLQQCFFGEHLLKLHPELPVSIVESEKTAVIASVYFPQFIWLATGGKHGCKWSSPQVSMVLIGRQITLWPDIRAYDDWQSKTYELRKSSLQITISNLIEQVATETEREAGLDIADYLIRFKPSQFTDISVTNSLSLPVNQSHLAKLPSSDTAIVKDPPEAISSIYHQFLLERHPLSFLQREGAGGEFWQLEELESFFSSTQLPDPPIRLNQCSVIFDLPKFISGHLAILKTYNGNKVFLPYLNRLQVLQQILKSSEVCQQTTSLVIYHH